MILWNESHFDPLFSTRKRVENNALSNSLPWKSALLSKKFLKCPCKTLDLGRILISELNVRLISLFLSQTVLKKFFISHLRQKKGICYGLPFKYFCFKDLKRVVIRRPGFSIHLNVAVVTITFSYLRQGHWLWENRKVYFVFVQFLKCQ